MARFTRGSDVAAVDVPVAQSHTFPHPGQSAPSASVRANKYGAKCTVCGVYVPEGQGTIVKNEATGKWDTTHIQPCPSADQAAVANKASGVGFKVPDGRYTVVWDNNYKTIRVQTQDEFDDFMPGVVILKYLSGANNDRDFTSFGHVNERGEVRIWQKHQANTTLREAVKVLLGDPKAASQAYALESNECSRCGHTLTVPASLHAGLGPDCAKKVSW